MMPRLIKLDLLFFTGKRFAEIDIKLVLSELLSQFEVAPCDKTEIPLQFKRNANFVTPKNGIWLTFTQVAD